MKNEPVFTAERPIKTITATRGGTNITVMLYFAYFKDCQNDGEIYDRIAQATREAEHRAEQLEPTPKPVQRIVRDPIAYGRDDAYVDLASGGKRGHR
jgi:hypothetical protein